MGKDRNDKAEIEDADVQSFSAWRVTINSDQPLKAGLLQTAAGLLFMNSSIG